MRPSSRSPSMGPIRPKGAFSKELLRQRTVLSKNWLADLRSDVLSQRCARRRRRGHDRDARGTYIKSVPVVRLAPSDRSITSCHFCGATIECRTRRKRARAQMNSAISCGGRLQIGRPLQSVCNCTNEDASRTLGYCASSGTP